MARNKTPYLVSILITIYLTFFGLNNLDRLIFPFSVSAQSSANYPDSAHITGFTITGNKRNLARGSDNWPITWAADDNQYTTFGDGGGFDDSTSVSFGIARITGEKENYTGLDIYEAPSGFTGKIYGILGVNGLLYFLKCGDGSELSNFKFVRLYKAEIPSGNQLELIDTGVQFTPPTENFFCPSFLQFGRDYEGAIDNFVYIYAPEISQQVWNVQFPGRIALLRVPKDQIENKGSYEYFSGMVGGEPTWTGDVSQRQPVFSYHADCLACGDSGVMRTSVSYNAALNRYLLITQQVDRLQTNNAHIGIYDAPNPWGPWTTVLFKNAWDTSLNGLMNSRAVRTVYYNFSNKWSNGNDFVLVYTDQDRWASMEGFFTSGPGDPTPTVTATDTPTLDYSSTPTAPPTDTPTPSSTPTPTDSPVSSSTPTSSATDTPTPTDSPIPSPTPTETATDTPIPSATPTPTDSPVPSPTPTTSATDTPTPSSTPTPTETVTVTNTPVPSSTPTPTDSPIPSPTPTVPATDTPTPSSTPTPTDLPYPSPTPTETATSTPASTDTPFQSPTPTETATGTPTPSATPAATDSPVPSPTPTATASATPTPTDSPNPSPTPTATATDSPVPSSTPTETATDTPTHSPTPTPSDSPVPSATPTATATETLTPSSTPTATDTPTPSSTPTSTATATPSPTITPTASPTQDFPPIVTITNPLPGDDVAGDVNVQASVMDDFGITRVDFYYDDTMYASDAEEPYEAAWDSTTIPNGEHSLAAKAYDTGGNITTESIIINVQNGDLEPPSAPTNLATTDVFWNEVDFYWDASTDNVGVVNYDVYRDGGYISSTGNTSFSDTGVTASTTYSYSVVAKDAASNVSNFSNVLEVSTPGQNLYGTLAGTVYSSAGGIIPNVKVSINIQGVQIVSYTNLAGDYSIGGLSTGGYSVKYIPPTTEHQQSSIQVSIQAGITTVQNVTLKKKYTKS